jgi:hypothetical protein
MAEGGCHDKAGLPKTRLEQIGYPTRRKGPLMGAKRDELIKEEVLNRVSKRQLSLARVQG